LVYQNAEPKIHRREQGKDMTEDNLATAIANTLRRKILRGDLPPGTLVKERDNALELGVSRTPMREAIRMLSTEGLISMRPFFSPRVADPSFEEVADQVLVLKTLEALSAELACARATDEDLEHIRTLNSQMTALYEAGDSLDLFEIDMAFHRAIAAAAHSEALAETHGAYLDRLWRVRYLAARQRQNRSRAKAHHEAILAGLQARDVAAVQVAIQQHLGNLAEDIRPILTEEQAARSGKKKR
jgi:GntR family transcriptional regulator, rspAB operon transcriptional repressor